MLNLETVLRRLRAFVLGSSSERDLDEELRYHVELLTMDNIAAGMSPEQAKADALRRFGNIERVKKSCRAVHRGSLSGATLWLIGIIAVCGAILWAGPYPSQANVLGQTLVITVLLFRLLMYLRAWPGVNGSSTSQASELRVFEATPTIAMEGSDQPRLNRGFSAYARMQMLKIAALCAVMAACLCAVVVVSSAKALSNHLRHAQENARTEADMFVGTWVLTVGDIYDLKDSSLPAPFRNLPQGLNRDLPLAEVLIEVRNGNTTGKRLLYHYTPGTNPQSPVVEKGEVELVNIRAQGNVISGDVTSPEGKQLPGGWEMKLTSDKEAEVRATGKDVLEEQKKLALKLHRLRK